MSHKESASGYARYLEAKRTVDERAINQHVWRRFIEQLNATKNDHTLRILEIGAGTGSTFLKVLDNLSHQDIIYRVVDLEGEHIDALFYKLKRWAEYEGGDIKEDAEGVVVNMPGRSIEVRASVCDIVHFLQSRTVSHLYDVVIGQAILDLFDIRNLLSLLSKALRDGGLYYFSINFDGVTAFLPEYNNEVDSLVEKIYHDSMKGERRDGSQSGRRVLVELMRLGAKIIQAGSSDWIVHPSENGGYIEDEEYFLIEILNFVKKELDASLDIESHAAEQWFTHRKKQVENGGLVFIAHQLDVLASKG